MNLISGANGFIGSALKKLISGRELPHRHLLNKDVARYFIRGTSPEFIFHLAAYGNHYQQKDRRETVTANIIKTQNLIEALKIYPCRKFYYFSSSSVFLKTQTLYSLSKLFAEKLIEETFKNSKQEYSIIYPYSIFGPGEDSGRLIPTIIRHLGTKKKMELDPDSVHDWTFIDDALNALLEGKTKLGTGVGTTNLDVVKMLEEISGKKLNFKIKKMRNYDCQDWVCPEPIYHEPLFGRLKQTYEKLRRENF